MVIELDTNVYEEIRVDVPIIINDDVESVVRPEGLDRNTDKGIEIDESLQIDMDVNSNSNIPYDMEVDEPLMIGKEANRELWNKYITRTTDSNDDIIAQQMTP
ncbi:hypothetical protein DLAC_08384 [Tieghemostelium lacteum]|uniref:Uncharacterized protein n=1 Tax=Tieghemostelium lacteum TaxID=361077 RepID=A0A151ZBV9_TIELA|nr:hypothetical protein DLAC_08384 [Tieghemostelium lacteum]|eukprot:KYQ91419.1 hypothetical protein DLAC_08384 [Tieghemostelium lacteum]